MATPSDQKLPTTSGISSSAVCRSPIAATCCAPNTWSPTRSAHRKAHPAPITTDNAFWLIGSGPIGVHPVADECHPRAALEEEPLRCPRPELGHGVEMGGANPAFRSIDRHPEHLATDVHPIVHAIPGIDEDAAGVTVRKVLFAGLTIPPQGGKRPAGGQPQVRRPSLHIRRRRRLRRRRATARGPRRAEPGEQHARAECRAKPPGHSMLHVRYARNWG